MIARTSKVAVVRAASRRVAVAESLALLGDDLRRVIPAGGAVLIKPNLVSHKYQLPSTHVDTFSATLDAVFSAGAKDAVVAEGASDATAAFERFGFRHEARELPVRFLDINRDETEWARLLLHGVDSTQRSARVSRTIVESPCVISLALAKTHVTSMVTLSMKNMLSSIHPADRILMHGFAGGGNGYHGWKKWVVEFLKQDNAVVQTLTRSMGLAKRARQQWRPDRRTADEAYSALSPRELDYLRSVVAMNRNLVALTSLVGPHLCVVDGFVGMHGEGPRHGTPLPLRTVIAGTDPVAVDSVAASIMGFDPLDVGYLALAEEAGLGVADPSRIQVVGDPIDVVRRFCTPHSNHRVQRHWRRMPPAGYRGPHFVPGAVPTSKAVTS